MSLTIEDPFNADKSQIMILEVCSPSQARHAGSPLARLFSQKFPQLLNVFGVQNLNNKGSTQCTAWHHSSGRTLGKTPRRFSP